MSIQSAIAAVEGATRSTPEAMSKCAATDDGCCDRITADVNDVNCKRHGCLYEKESPSHCHSVQSFCHSRYNPDLGADGARSACDAHEQCRFDDSDSHKCVPK